MSFYESRSSKRNKFNNDIKRDALLFTVIKIIN